MNNKVIVKIFSRFFLILTLAMVSSLAISPNLAQAEIKLDWENPNSGKSPYKFKINDYLNSSLVMQVVGCTGVVNKVSNTIMNFVQGKAQEKAEELKVAAVIKACEALKGASGSAVSTIPNVTISTVLMEVIDCKRVNQTKDKESIKLQIKEAEKENSRIKMEQCLNGIAVTLAKNQLTSMTRDTMNWINTGFKGDPMYVRDITSFTSSLEKNVLETGIQKLVDPNNAYPYGTQFSQSVINSYRSGSSLTNGYDKFMNSLKSDLGSFLTDPNSYYSNPNGTNYNGSGYENTGYYGTETTITAQERAKQDNERFANDFSVGGWEGWLALTQRDQNNPLGFTMLATQNLQNKQAQDTQNTKDALLQNDGFLSQSRCVLWQQYLEEGIPDTELIINDDGSSSFEPIFNKSKVRDFDQCVKEEVVTPGSIVKEKLTTYINSPERQLELVDTINEALNSVFSKLISKLQNEGLSSITTQKYNYLDDENMGLGKGSNDSFGNLVDSSSGFSRSNFDLTRDLGNTFIHNYQKKSLGNWNAKTNQPKLTTNGLVNGLRVEPNSYYIVTTAGKTQLINNGYNGWAVGDRAFWDGKSWQNWKAGQANPIEKRGVIQIQKDYIVVVKELLSVLPNIMPKIGELDYCIPGPNQNWEANSGDANAAFSNYAYSLNSEYKDGAFLKRDKTIFSIAKPGESEYDDYEAIFSNTAANMWGAVQSTNFWTTINSYDGTLKKDSEEENRQKEITDFLNKLGSKIQQFFRGYNEYIVNTYGRNSLMQKEFIESEDSSEILENPRYLPMAETGLNITKDILTYNEDINAAIINYQTSITTANSNIYKLEKIKARVNEIVKQAQARRDENLLRILKEESEINGTPVLTEQEYKEKYKDCLDEEEIIYLDDTYIMGDGLGDEKRCEDNVDNDLDGMIDKWDSDCKGNNGGNGSSYEEDGFCKVDSSIEQEYTTEDTETQKCEGRDTATECESEPYYHLGVVKVCKWTSNNNGGGGQSVNPLQLNSYGSQQTN